MDGKVSIACSIIVLTALMPQTMSGKSSLDGGGIGKENNN